MGNNESAMCKGDRRHSSREQRAPEHKHGSHDYGTLVSSAFNGFQLESGSADDLELKLYEAGRDFDEESDIEEVGGINYTGKGNLQKFTVPPSFETEEINKSIKLKVYSSSDVRIDVVVGEGEFGKVSKAFLVGNQRLPVAVKAFNSPFNGNNFIGQLSVITKLKHRNVVSVLGILDSPAPPTETASMHNMPGPRVLLHYFPEGNLLQFLSKSDNPSDYATLVKLALDVIQGCEYLHSKKVIHGNLAARNILVEKQYGRMSTHYNAKVSDHGIIQLAKPKGCGKHYLRIDNGSILPIRWAPKELLFSNNNKRIDFSFASDVWSFGIVLWEILTKGKVPYGKKKEESKVLELIKDGHSPISMPVPPYYPYPNEMLEVMRRMFKVIPAERPSFCELKKDFISISTSIKSQHMGYNKYKPDARKGDQIISTVKYNSTDGEPLGCGRKFDRSKSGEREPIRGRFNGPINNGYTSAGRLPTKVNLLKSSENPIYHSTIDQINRPSKLMETKGRCISTSSQYPDHIPPKSADFKNQSLQRPPISRPSSPPISAFHALNIQHNNGPYGESLIHTSMAVPPPPYTPNPLPNHSAYGARGVIVHESPHHGERKPNYAKELGKEIRKKEKELEQLKVQQLKQEASQTWGKMQTIISQLAELKAGAEETHFGNTRGEYHQQDRRKGFNPHRGTGRGERGGGRGRGGGDRKNHL